MHDKNPILAYGGEGAKPEPAKIKPAEKSTEKPADPPGDGGPDKAKPTQ